MKGLLWGLVALIVLVIVLDATKEEPTDWTPSYVHSDERALGTEIFFEGLASKASNIERLGQSPFELFQGDSDITGTYFFLNNYVSLTKKEVKDLSTWVNSGNTAFIASQGIPAKLLDTLDLDVSFFVSNSEIEYQPSFNLTDKKLKLINSKTSKKAFEYLYFSEMDSTKTQVLGNVKSADSSEDLNHINFIQVNWGKGKFLLHLSPQVFTNYFMVDGSNSNYTSRTLGYLNLEDNLFWDTYYKSGKEKISNPLYYLLSNPYLKSAYYLILITSLLYVIFGGKRKQRPIPIIPPVENRSYEFAQTIAGMYLDKKDHKGIAQKQIISFLEHIRSTYNLSTNNINTTFLNELAFKTGKSYEDLEALFQYIEHINTSEEVSQQELKTLDKKITTFNR